ncbi:DMT family transporter [Mariniluteicoccus flavus]
MTQPPRRSSWPVLFAALSLVWGASFLLIKVGLYALVPLQIAAGRMVSGALVLVVLALALRTRWPREWSTVGHLFVTALFLCSIPYTLFALAGERVPSALSGIGNASTPLWTAAFSTLFLPTDRLTRRKAAALLVGIVGVLVILQPWQVVGRPDPLGFAMVLGASCCYGIGWVYNRRFIGGRDLGGLAQPTMQLVLASVQMIVVYAVAWAAGFAPAPLTVHASGSVVTLAVGSVLALGLVGTGLATWVHYDIVRAAGPTVGTMVTYVIPVVAVALGAAFLGERLSPLQFVGAALVIAAPVLMYAGTRRKTT